MQVRAQSPHLPPARADTSGQSSPGSSTQLGLGALPSAPHHQERSRACGILKHSRLDANSRSGEARDQETAAR